MYYTQEVQEPDWNKVKKKKLMKISNKSLKKIGKNL